MTTRIKICGVKTPTIAQCASEAGADAIGLVFYAPSVRAVTLAQARAVIAASAPLLSVVGLFVDPSADEVNAVLDACDIDCLQFHGSESAAFCEQFRRPYIKAVTMRPEVDVASALALHPQARSYLFDAWREGMPGGTGETFAWDRLPSLSQAWLLAGGLNAANVGKAVAEVRPPAVDVSGGVEVSPGEKSPVLLRQFVDAVRQADKVCRET